jgi:hypothetical protein
MDAAGIEPASAAAQATQLNRLGLAPAASRDADTSRRSAGTPRLFASRRYEQRGPVGQSSERTLAQATGLPNRLCAAVLEARGERAVGRGRAFVGPDVVPDRNCDFLSVCHERHGGDAVERDAPADGTR